jgi:hypothetical protein
MMSSHSGGRLVGAPAKALATVRGHPGWFALATALLLIAVANIIVAGILRAHLSFGAELGLEVLIVFVGISVPVGLTLGALWPELKAISSLVSEGPAAATPIMLRFVGEELKLLHDRVADLRSRGIDLELNDVTPWIRQRCFAVSSGRYCATDVLVPSEFVARFVPYLRAHADYVARTRQTDSCRVNIASAEMLERDRCANPDDWETYRKWHTDNGVRLLYLDPGAVGEYAREVGLDGTTDIATWDGDVVLLVEYRDDGETNLRTAFVGEIWYQRGMSFMQRVVEQAQPFDASLHLKTPSAHVSADGLWASVDVKQ